MKFNLSFAEVRSIAEFLNSYKGGYISKAYLGDGAISLKFRKGGLESYYLHFYLPDILFLSRENRINQGKSIEFLEDFKIIEILAPGTDRWILIQGVGKSISLELMGGGNLIVTEGDKIIFKIKEIKRKSKNQEIFSPPDIIDFASDSFNWEEEILKSTGDPVRTLAARIGLSKYAEEAICSLGVQVKSNKDLLGVIEKLKEYSISILEKAKEKKIYDYGEKYLVLESNCIKTMVEPKPIQIALEEIFDRISSEDFDKKEAILRDMEKLKAESIEMKEKGDIIMQHFSEIQEALDNARRGKLKSGIDFEKRKIELQLDGKVLELSIDKSAGENANMYYEASKKIRSKLERIDINGFKTPQKERKKKNLQRIFQNYRWFITSEGNLVLAGKDAESNDSVVKKYLDEKDLYLHADIHGAPSVVLKNINGIGERSINEAAQFAWCMSKAWSAGFGNGSVFYVSKSQVSKSPESGEYVPRGAWIIRGKKNYISHLELKLGIGIQKYQNRDYAVSAPISALTEPYVAIVPGEDSQLVDKISVFLGIEKELIYPILPPGKSMIEGFYGSSGGQLSKVDIEQD